MGSQSVWSMSLGKWMGIQVRVHMFFLLFAVFTLFLCTQDDGQSFWVGCLLLSILFFSVLLHEIGHVLMAAHLGGNTDEIVVGPLGGLGRASKMTEAPADLITSITGPLVNASVCLFAAILLLVAGNFDANLLMNPFAIDGFSESAHWISALKICFYVNWVLFLLNMIPAFPFDGARAFRSLILTAWPEMEPRRAIEITARTARIVAFLFLLAAILVATQENHSEVVPVWLPLVLLSIFVYFSAKNEDVLPNSNSNSESFMGYDFSEGFTSLERSAQPCSIQADTTAPSPLATWLQNRREQRNRRRKEREADEDSRVDDLLTKVHESGFDSLSSDDQALLRRVSVRYQNRRVE